MYIFTFVHYFNIPNSVTHLLGVQSRSGSRPMSVHAMAGEMWRQICYSVPVARLIFLLESQSRIWQTHVSIYFPLLHCVVIYLLSV